MTSMQTLRLRDQVQEAVAFVRPRLAEPPRVAIILGSGLGRFSERICQAEQIDTAEIPYYPHSTVPGHAGRWFAGRLGATPVIAVQGRVHYYEGYDLKQVIFPVHLLASLGIEILIVTTASGGLNPQFAAGDLMLITDQLNFTFTSPLTGRPEDQLGPRFPDMMHCYDPGLLEVARAAAQRLAIPLREGIFCWVTGPAYETAAEVRMLRLLGGDAVSMSTAPEVIAARQRHLRVLGISLITNPGTGLSKVKLTHEEVTTTADQAGTRLGNLLEAVVADLAEDRPGLGTETGAGSTGERRIG
ncbi:MAG TPA: purine-nucleoside phosphorylase [bacterium]|nr:purine-nucleoside phosphorylase [bacterium]HQG44694.1 purine-nucleoside phosphorylase [bacterium]HQI47334.1 purine-nucleoside phosphorylase [bacterium]HQJ63391.1 purine-nucleoside phosphorylase [bacterium]